MSKQRWVDWTALIVILLLGIFYAWTLEDIPFHPDESTQIYMSKDFSSLFSDPLGLSWEASPQLSDEERIRAIDAPLAKFIIGFLREISSTPPLAADWNWSLSWVENQSAGALPSSSQLLIARAAIAAFLPISLWFYYLVLKKVMPAIPALIALTLLGLNPLILLHGRRAMSEGILIFGIAFLLWTITRDERNPWMIGLALGISINAKYSALGLFPAAYLALILLPDLDFNLKRAAGNILKASLICFLSIILLNPFYWKQPFAALKTGLNARYSLAKQQDEDYLGQEEKLRITIPSLVLNTYFTSPQTEEVGNYLLETKYERKQYLSAPLINLGRDNLSGSILLSLTIVGIGRMLFTGSGQKKAVRHNYLILALGTLGICVFTIYLLPWQRYVVPILPFTFIWIGAGLIPFFKTLSNDITATPTD